MQDDAKCPCCGEPQEPTLHLLQCTGHDANTCWEDNMLTLEDNMKDLKTHPDLLQGLITRLNQWRYNQALVNDIDWDPQVIHTLQQQDQLGWKNMLECLPVKKWKEVQQQYFDQHQLDRSVNKWMTKLLKELHNLAWHQWDHRNKILHKVELPRLKATLEQLDEEIVAELRKGPEDLPPNDRRHFRTSIMALLNRQTPYKQSWLLNVHHARQRQQRRLNLEQETITLQKSRSDILHWIKTGLLR